MSFFWYEKWESMISSKNGNNGLLLFFAFCNQAIIAPNSLLTNL